MAKKIFKYKLINIRNEESQLIAKFESLRAAERTLDLFVEQEKTWSFKNHYQIKRRKKVLVSR